MKWTSRSIVELTAVLVVTAVVAVLAVLQYRWTGTISQANQQRLNVDLDTSVRNFNQEFSYDFERLCEGFEVDAEAPAATIETRLLHQYSDWIRSTAEPALLMGVYVWRTDGTGAGRLESLDSDSLKFPEAAWPVRLAPLREMLRQRYQQVSPMIGDREALYYPWTFYEYGDVSALARPLFQVSPSASIDAMEARPIGFVVVEFDRAFLEQQYLPEMVSRHFGALALENFGVTVRSASAPYRPVYVSETTFAISGTSPDAKLDLFDSVADQARQRGHAPLEPSSEGQGWQLAVQHPAGSLEIGVTEWRRRSLAVSFGLLGLLVGCTVLVVSVARRAERLAKMQMEFVAGVSHELCTPLAVINSAAENLADGVVDDPAQMRQYGGMIRDQGRRLERLVDEVLSFAAGQSERPGYDLRPVEIGSLVARTLVLAEPLLREAGFAVEREISPNLPVVAADPAAVGTCIENLINNAVKYAGANRWIAIRVQAAAQGARPEVEISVEDKGIGISPADAAHVFEPFYRVKSVRDGQIRGVGLGLYLVKRLMEGMGGRVSLSSVSGRGSRFSLYLPMAQGTVVEGSAAENLSHQHEGSA